MAWVRDMMNGIPQLDNISKVAKTGFLLVFSLLTLAGCTLRPPDAPDGPTLSLEAKLEILCAGCTPENKSGKAPFFAVFDATKSKGDIVSYAITILNEKGDVLYGPIYEALVSYTFEVPGSYRVVLEVANVKGSKDTTSVWVLVEGPDRPSVEWSVGKFVDISVSAPDIVKLGEAFTATLRLRVHSPMEFLYINVIGFGSISLNSRVETTINQPREGVYEFAVSGTGETEGQGTLLIDIQGGPPGENDKRKVEWIITVQK